MVVKIGSSVISNAEKQVDFQRLKKIASEAKTLQEQGYKLAFVISGAVVCGEGTLGLARSDDMSKRLLAGGGQAYLISKIYEAFDSYGLKIVQMLLTKKDFERATGSVELKEIISQAMDHGFVPVINENDVADLNSFDGNDFLASSVACLLGCSYLVVLTDVDGVYDGDMRLMSEVSSGDFCRLAEIEIKSNKGSVGGMQAKILASEQAANNEVQTFIANGREDDVLLHVIVEQSVGTKVLKRNS